MKTLLRLLEYARPLSKFAIPFFIFSTLSVIFGVLNFTLIKPLLDVLFQTPISHLQKEILEKPTFSFNINFLEKLFNYNIKLLIQKEGKYLALKFVCIIIVVSSFFSNIFKYLTARVLEHFRFHIIVNVREVVFQKAIKLDLSYFSTIRKGNIISRLTTDVLELENAIVSVFIAFLKEPIALIVYIIALFLISVKLTLFTLIVIPVSGILIAALAKRMRQEAFNGQDAMGKMLSVLDETFGGMRIIKAFNAFKYVTKKFQDENLIYKRSLQSMANLRELASPFSEFTGVLVVTGILLYGGSLILNNPTNQTPELTASEFILYIVIFSQILSPAKNITNAFSNIQRGIVAGQRVLEIIDTEPTIVETPNALDINNIEKNITFKNVHFSYNPGQEVLKDINFTIEKGKTYALVGSSGGGKSTIADLLARFYDPTGGSITIDGIDLKNLKLESLRNLIGIVTQEPILFNDTIFNNISFGLNVSEDEVIKASKIAHAHDFIVLTENQYQTVIGDRGSKLSGGQRQRISIARAILKNPPILILDEATSALDNESEKFVQEALLTLMKNRTSLVIAHRLSTIQDADEILVIQDGEIVERGNHQILMDINKGVYKKLNQILD